MFSQIVKSISSALGRGEENEGTNLQKNRLLSEDLDLINGSKLNNIYFPDELLIEILINVNIETLLQCRLVCYKWKLLLDKDVFKYKAIRYLYEDNINNKQLLQQNYNWELWYSIQSKQFYKNLIINPNGHDNLNGWIITSNGGDNWNTESTPIGCLEIPEDKIFNQLNSNYYIKPYNKLNKKQKINCKLNYCFVTSYGKCEKYQIINLNKFQFINKIMDSDNKPTIVYSEWYTRRHDCGGIYILNVQLLDEDETVLVHKSHKCILTEDKKEWYKVENKFENYPNGVRYIKFIHSGVDNQYWKEHYGPKITRSCVYFVPPRITHDINIENNIPESNETLNSDDVIYAFDQINQDVNFQNHREDPDNWDNPDNY